MNHLEFKVIDQEKILVLEAKQDSGELHCPVTALIRQKLIIIMK